MSEPVYRRGRQQFYLRPRSHSWIGTLFNPFFGVPVCEPNAVDTMAQALVREVIAYAEAVGNGALALSEEAVGVGSARETFSEAKAVSTCG
jgi:hypothetical protein